MSITGFTYSDWKQYNEWYEEPVLWLYYTRNSYNLRFENCQPMDPESIKFEAKLSTGKPSRDPGRPSYVDSDYTFAGWYLDPGFKEPVNWNETMTEDGLTIYAKWEKPKYTVDFVTNCKEEKASITREKGFVLTEEELAAPDKADDEFLGWYTDSALTKKFIPESQIVKDTTLYARWRNSDTVTYTVKYMCGDVAIADAKQQTVIRNSTVSEPAETVEGYYPETLSISAMITKDGQEIIFKYRAVQSWTYTVKYLLEGTKTPVPGSTVETGTTSDQNVMITFKTFEGYTLKSDPVQKVTQENQVVIFYYVPKTAIYHIQHWYERPNGEFGLRYIDTFNTAAGQSVTTRGQEIPVDGFTLDTSIAGTVTDGTTNIQNVLSLKLYYTRNTHQVSYQYEGDVPTGAPAVPDVANHKYQAQVAVAENPNVTGYIFSGWTAATENGTAVTTTGGKFVMPDANVVLKGSFKAAEQTYRVKYLDEDKNVEIRDMSDPRDAHFGDEIKGYTEKIEISGYTFVRADDLTVGTDNEQNIVTVYYSEDTNEDDIPDKYQITFTYVSADDDKGTVTGTTSEIATVYEIFRDSETGEITELGPQTPQHPTQPSTVTPKDGYRFEKWQQDDLTFFNSDDELRNSEYLEDQTFIAHFTVRRDLHYEIHYFYEDANGVVTEDTAAAIVSDIGVFGEKILTTTVPKESEFNGKHYVLERIEGADKQVGFNPDENIVNVYYSMDEIGEPDPDEPDNIPDKYQITFTYVSADANKGTVTGTTKEVVTTYEITRDSVTGEITATNGPTAQHPTQPSTVTPKDGYRFEKWQQDDLTFFNSDDELRNSEYLEDQTFIAHFTVRRDLHYEIHYFYEDANGVVTEDTAAAIVSDIGVFGEKILTTTVPKESEFNGKHYVLERIEGADKQIGLDPKENMVNVYYSMDEIGEIDPDEPDNIPDKYQVTFQYISEDPSYGTVSGKVKEIVTRPKNADGTYNMTAPVHPKAEVTVAGIGNYKFNRWSDGNTNYSAASEIAKAGFIADTTFTAYFSYSGGNSGGGSSGGGGGGSHRSTISNTSGGPGVTTTITPGDVPMAELPESPAPIVIDDGEIPMAALPKTGQTTVKAALTMMFSGIFLALTAIGRKKKEQDV